MDNPFSLRAIMSDAISGSFQGLSESIIRLSLFESFRSIIVGAIGLSNIGSEPNSHARSSYVSPDM